MADNQEQFSYEEYKTYKRVAKILAEDGGEPDKEPVKNEPESDDPSVAYREKQKKLWEERERKAASVTDEQIKLADRVLDGIRW